MKVVFVTNFMNHHQVHVADELFKLLGTGYKFIETMPIPDWILQSGYSKIVRSYIVKAYEDDKSRIEALELAYDADVTIIGSAPDEFISERLSDNKMTFRYNERWFKKKPWYLTGFRGWIELYNLHIKYRNRLLYMLAASAYTANDAYAIGTYKDKVYKWGYFTKVDEAYEVETSNRCASTLGDTQLMWCARFLRWKHPELPVQLAKRLKEKGYRFTLDMYGSGVELEKTKLLTKKLDVEDVVRFCGNLPNDQLLQQMRQHEILLFTSDKNEGWGAVLNESMANGCAVVGSNLIGAVPFLIKDDKNGCIFESGNLNSLEEKVRFLIDNPTKRKEITRNAIKTMQELWCPQNAAKQFLNLVTALQTGYLGLIPKEGPGSKAEKI